MFPAAHPVGELDTFPQLFLQLHFLGLTEMVYKKLPALPLDPAEYSAIGKGFSRDKMDVLVIRSQLVDRCKAHQGKQGHPGFHGMATEISDFTVDRQEAVKRATDLSDLPFRKSWMENWPQE
jgi:hypothetical protein